MRDGFAMFDAEDRLLLCNTRFRDLHALGWEAPLVGRTYGDILRAFLAESPEHQVRDVSGSGSTSSLPVIGRRAAASKWNSRKARWRESASIVPATAAWSASTRMSLSYIGASRIF